MALADRVAVMDRGRLLQVAAPDELYHRPATPTVAGFVGTSTVVPVSVLGSDALDSRQVDVLGAAAQVRSPAGSPRTGAGYAMFRPGDLAVEAASGPDSFSVRVVRRIYAGGHVLLRLAHTTSGHVFTLSAAETSSLGEGDTAWLKVRGGWLIPHADPV
jgi:iron(III) transport system ATP-binding protein